MKNQGLGRSLATAPCEGALHSRPGTKSTGSASYRQFEECGVDVLLTIIAGHETTEFYDRPKRLGLQYDYSWHEVERRFSFKIEIKPTIGDDYPAVLRQMKRNRSEVLLVGNYVGVGATRQQFITTFATADKRVVFVEEIV